MVKNQKGFAILETFLILVILGVIGGISWYAIHTKHQTDKILSQADKISQGTPITSNTKSPQSSVSNIPGYLDIKEWGVKIKLSSNLSDIHYLFNDNQVSLHLKSVDSLHKQDGSACSTAESNLMLLSRMTSQQYNDYLSSSGFENVAPRVGDYYYIGVAPDGQILCTYSATGQNLSSLVSEKRQSLADSVLSLQAI